MLLRCCAAILQTRGVFKVLREGGRGRERRSPTLDLQASCSAKLFQPFLYLLLIQPSMLPRDAADSRNYVLCVCVCVCVCARTASSVSLAKVATYTEKGET